MKKELIQAKQKEIEDFINLHPNMSEDDRTALGVLSDELEALVLKYRRELSAGEAAKTQASVDRFHDKANSEIG